MPAPLKFIKSTPDLPAEADVVVIGAGIIGSFTAYYLAQRGLKVALLEKGVVGGRTIKPQLGAASRTAMNANCRWPPRRWTCGNSSVQKAARKPASGAAACSMSAMTWPKSRHGRGGASMRGRSA
jgi:glycine/D-amino acid oxidase-like deaminating enzyme